MNRDALITILVEEYLRNKGNWGSHKIMYLRDKSKLQQYWVEGSATTKFLCNPLCLSPVKSRKSHDAILIGYVPAISFR